jgi:hypothetical protein
VKDHCVEDKYKTVTEMKKWKKKANAEDGRRRGEKLRSTKRKEKVEKDEKNKNEDE